MKDKEILELLRKNDKQVIAALYKSYPPVERFVRRYGGNAEDARDVFQDSLIVLFQNVRKSDFELTCSVGYYIQQVCKYMWKDKLKVKNRTISMTDFQQLESEISDNQIQEKEIKENRFYVLEKAIRRLGGKCQEVLNFYYIQKLSMKAIAEKLGYGSVATAKTRKYKCLAQLRKIIQQQNQLI